MFRVSDRKAISRRQLAIRHAVHARVEDIVGESHVGWAVRSGVDEHGVTIPRRPWLEHAVDRHAISTRFVDQVALDDHVSYRRILGCLPCV